MSVVGIAAVIFDEIGRILCVRQNYREKVWALPGGAVELGESPIEALEREVREETGYLIRTGELIGVYVAPWKDTYFLCFMAEVVGESGWHANEEIAARAFFERGQLPTPMSRRMQQRIADAFDGKRGVLRIFEPGE